MPTTSDEIREQLNMKDTVYALENAFRTYLPAGHTVGQARPLFKRIEKHWLMNIVYDFLAKRNEHLQNITFILLLVVFILNRTEKKTDI